jgi:hypothetical protein
MSKSEVSVEANKPEIRLPVEKKHLADFIQSLISSDDSISRYLIGHFELHKSDIAKIYHLITQKVSEQKQGTLISSKFTINDGENFSETFRSIDSFINSNQIHDHDTRLVGMELNFSIDLENTAPIKHKVCIYN